MSWNIVAVGAGAESIVQLLLFVTQPGYVFRPLPFLIGVCAASAWASLARSIRNSPKVQSGIARFQRTKAYDLIAALPLIVFYLLGVWKQAPLAYVRLDELLTGHSNLLRLLQLGGLLATLLMSLLIIVLLLSRKAPELKAKGALPRVVAVCGTFLSTAILQLKAVNLSLPFQVVADALIVTGAIGAIVCLSRLRTSFSVMPEARTLVTSGPYAIIRHPLYTFEALGLAGFALQFQQPWSTMFSAVVFALLFWRTVFEETVLSEAYPAYKHYKAHTWRFVPHLF
jgi:protein-S-isoprenylcysteine O-methyltransferase Ste14